MESGRKRIILVDDVLTNLRIGSEILSALYDVFTVPSAEKLFRMLETTTPDLILLDIDMPGMNGYEAIKTLKENEKTRRIPVIFLSANCGPDCESKGFSLGAVDFVSKPYSPRMLLNRVGTHLRLESQQQLIHEYELQLRQVEAEKARTLTGQQKKVIKIAAKLGDRRDEAAGGHMEQKYTLMDQTV